MSLNIKNEETVRLAREVAAATGENLTTAIGVALAERLERLRSDEVKARRIQRIHEIAADAAKRWPPGVTSANATDFLYDELGLPK
jgi:antitoxin VapB